MITDSRNWQPNYVNVFILIKKKEFIEISDVDDPYVEI